MKAVRYHEHGGPDVLMVDDVARPEPGDGELLVKTLAAGVNPVDTYFREGTYEPASLPMIPGSDFAGEIVQVGPDVEGFERGERVFGTGLGKDRQGTYAEYVTTPPDRVARLPTDASSEEGAAIALVGVTAWRALIHYGGLGPAETCLIHGGSGGVGHIAVQLASVAGADVVATVGSREAGRTVEELGADLALRYGRGDLKGAVADFGRPDVILDHMLDEYLQFDLDVAERKGRIVGIGEAGEVLLTDTPAGRGKDLTIHLMSMFNTPDMGAVLGRLARLMRRRDLEPVVSETFRMERASEAQRRVMEESFVGKLVITP